MDQLYRVCLGAVSAPIHPHGPTVSCLSRCCIGPNLPPWAHRWLLHGPGEYRRRHQPRLQRRENRDCQVEKEYLQKKIKAVWLIMYSVM